MYKQTKVRILSFMLAMLLLVQDCKLIYAMESDINADSGTQLSEAAEQKSMVITSCSAGSDYDNSKDYLYLSLRGSDLSPDKLDYSLKQDREIISLTYVSYKHTHGGAVVKLKKEGAISIGQGKITLTAKDGYLISGGKYQATIQISSGLFYSGYNAVTRNMEAAFSSDTNSEGKNVKLSIWEGKKKGDDSAIVATGTAVVSDGVAYIPLKTPQGEDFTFQDKNYYLSYVVNAKEYSASWSGNDSTSTNYWNIPSIIAGDDSVYCYFYSDLIYNSESSNAVNYTAKVTGETLEHPIQISSGDQKIRIEENVPGNTTLISMNFDLSSLNTGEYTITLYRNNAELSKEKLYIYERNNFVLEYVSLYWESASEIRAYICTPFSEKNDNYTITLVDLMGNEVENLVIEEAARYETGVDYLIKGLLYADADKSYFVKVVHNTLGEAYTQSGESYYTNKQGELINLYHGFCSEVIQNNRLVGLYLATAQFPVTIKVYKPYQTDSIREIVIEDKLEQTNGYYYFTKMFCDELPNPNSLYDIVVMTNDKRVSVIEKKAFGYKEEFPALSAPAPGNVRWDGYVAMWECSEEWENFKVILNFKDKNNHWNTKEYNLADVEPYDSAETAGCFRKDFTQLIDSLSMDANILANDFYFKVCVANDRMEQVSEYVESETIKTKVYSITYHMNGGKNNDSNLHTYKVIEETIKLKPPTRTGYRFKGWYNEKGKKVTSIPKGSTGNKVFEAKWTANTYNVEFKGNKSTSGSMSKMSNRKYGNSYTLKSNTFKRTGYTFAGWNTKADGSGTAYANKARIKNLTSTNKKTVTLYAQWKKKHYSITYVLKKGKQNSANPDSYTITTSTITLKNPSRKGYKFKGWYKDKKYTKKVEKIKKGSTGNLELYAKWEAKKYDITYVLNQGKNSSKNPSGYKITTSDIKLKAPTRQGYEFKGWYKDKKYTQKVTKIKKGSTGNLKLYAKWVKK